MLIKLSNLKDKKVTVALSGGGDSIALLHFLAKHRQQYNILLSAVHIHHMIRGQEAEEDAKFVKEICTAWKIPLYFVQYNIPQLAKQEKKSLEEMGRKMRYQYFHSLLQEKTDCIVTAHHADDNVESLFMNLLRGTAMKGVKGIAPKIEIAKNKEIIRPLLWTTKKEILQYLKKNNLCWREDSSNQEEKFTRNFLRNKLQGMETVFTKYQKKVAHFCQTISAEDTFLDALAEKEILFAKTEVSFPIHLPDPLFYRAVLLALKHFGINKDYTAIHLKAIHALQNLQNGKKHILPSGVEVVRAYEKILFLQAEKIDTICLPFQLGSFVFFDKRYSIEEVESVQKGKGLYIDGDSLGENVVIRTREGGDIFTKFGGGRKKLKEYFIDNKIPAYRRNKIPLLARGKEILAVFGMQIARQLAVQKHTKKILSLKEEEYDKRN